MKAESIVYCNKTAVLCKADFDYEQFKQITTQLSCFQLAMFILGVRKQLNNVFNLTKIEIGKTQFEPFFIYFKINVFC